MCAARTGEHARRAGTTGAHGARHLCTQPDGQPRPDDARHAPHARGGDDATARHDAPRNDDAAAGHGDGVHVGPHEVLLLAHRARLNPIPSTHPSTPYFCIISV